MNEKRFKYMTSKQLADEQVRASIVYFPTGALEPHGQQLPVGFDSLWVHRACLASVQRTGGVGAKRGP